MASLISWIAVIFLIIVSVLLLMQKQSGLKLIQHRVEMLPQAMLVRYLALALLALIASWIGAPRVQFAMLLAMAVIGLGDAYIYRRAGHPFWMHVAIGGGAFIGAFFALLNFGGNA